MTINFMNASNNSPTAETGEWFVATRAMAGRSLADLDITRQTGAIVLLTRQGFWNSSLNRYDIEIFLWGSSRQLAFAQEKYRLRSSTDALLDHPEPY
ncbi:MAG: hypothetical protein AB7V06_18880 [Candidatus Obscuribacterales bacterium]